MQDKLATQQPLLSLSDVYHVLFRRKWLIIAFAMVGVIAALGVYTQMPRIYQSEAKLYVRYVLESRSPVQVGPDDRTIRQPDQRGENAINTELAILSSLDLAQQVADAIGPEKILGMGATNRYAAAVVIQKNLTVEAPRFSNVIRVTFQHSDPGIVQAVVTRLIDLYFKKHAEIHGVGAFDEFLTQETDQLRSRLILTEEKLRVAKAQAGVISLPEAKKGYTEQLAQIRQEVLAAEAELAEQKAAADQLAALLHTTPLAATTNQPAVPAERIGEYRRVTALLETLRTKEAELVLLYAPSSSILKQVQEQIAANETLKRELERKNPGLLALHVSETRTAAAPEQTPSRAGTDLIAAMARVAALESRVKVLTNQLDKVRKEATTVEEAEPGITELQRKRDLEEQHYRRFIENLEQSRIDEKLGSGKVSNISIVQQASPPLKASSKRLKTMSAALFGCLIGGIALAFLIELYLDKSIKRLADVETKLGLPVFLSIPWIRQNGAMRLPTNSGSPSPSPPNGHFEGLDRNQALRPFSEALRDRLIAFFETRNLAHKPKLVALTSCAAGSGVTTAAAGLAAALSETGEGNVLLVDMTLAEGAAHHFYRGQLSCGLDDALEAARRGGALVQENLYVVTEGSKQEKLPSVLPKRFRNLVPRLKASDFDFIIFDMPPINQISITPTLARFMDMVLLVVESEKTDREVAKRAAALISESKVNMAVILNKTRSYVPRRLQQEL